MDDQWKDQLTPEQYRLLRQSGTEPPFTGAYWDEHAKGEYVCAGCGQTLFRSDDKFDSGTGWPSFVQAADEGKVTLHADDSEFMQRVEVRCAGCGGHLGHLFDDGPKDRGGQRYCINSAALRLEKASAN
jgi:peptide-methionine (R)-S-oxide reductase